MSNIESLEKSIYKRKIILAVSIIVLILIIGYFSQSKYVFRNNSELSLAYEPSNLDYIVNQAGDDPDGDGLENWKEQLLGSDPSSANGTSIYSTSSRTDAISPDNLTEQVAISLYASANALRNSGDTSTSSMAAISSAIASQALNKSIPVIDDSKVSITSDNSKAALKLYANSVFANVITYYPKVDETFVLNSYYKDEDATVLSDLDPNIQSLELMLSEMYKVKVPSDVYSLHKELLTYILSAIEMEKSFKKADKDVLSTMMAFKELQSMQSTIEALFNKYKVFYDSKNIVFTSKEPGSLMNK